MPVYVNVPAIAGVIVRFAAGLADPTASRSTIGDASSITTDVGTTFSDAISWIVTGDSAFAVSAARFGGASADAVAALPFAALPFAAPPAPALPASVLVSFSSVFSPPHAATSAIPASHVAYRRVMLGLYQPLN